MSKRARVTYAIVAHSREAQLVRLVRALRQESPECSVVVHWDKCSPALDEQRLRALGNVHLVDNPVHPEWGEFEMVCAILRLMRAAVAKTRFDWFVLLSGQDYPIAPLAQIEQELAAAECDAFVDGRRVASGRLAFRWRADEATRLGRRYYFAYTRLPTMRRRLPRLVRGVGLRILFALDACQPFVALWPMPRGVPWRVGVRRLRTPFDAARPCRAGSSWFNVSHRGVHRVLEHAEKRRQLVRHFRRTLHSDESFFQTIICGDPELTVLPDTKRYQVWQQDGSPLHPNILKVDDLPGMLKSGKHFARKFDAGVDTDVLDLIDAGRRSISVQS